jgi:hypothetical protein
MWMVSELFRGNGSSSFPGVPRGPYWHTGAHQRTHAVTPARNQTGIEN